MIPPAPAINDAIGLLAAISDPARAAVILQEAKEHIETANKIFSEVHEAQREVDIERKTRAQEREEIERKRHELAQETASHKSRIDADSRGLVDWEKALDEKVRTLDELNAKAAQRHAEADARQTALDHKETELKAREGQVVLKEVKAEELMKLVQPLMDRLK